MFIARRKKVRVLHNGYTVARIIMIGKTTILA